MFGTFPKGSTESFLISQGAKGVDIFFAISGFLITSRLLDERDKFKQINIRNFYLRRVFRILPPYALYLAILAMLAATGVVTVSRREWVASMLFFRNYLPEPDVRGWYTAHLWSLSVEEHFYIFWPLTLVLLGRFKAGSLAVILALAISVWRKIDQHYQILFPLGMGRSDTHMDAIMWGAFAAIVVHNPAARAWLARRLTLAVWVCLLAVVVALALAEPPFGRTLLAFIMPWLLVGTVFNPTSLPARILEATPLRWVGRLSYSLYLWQQLCISRVWINIGVFSVDTPWYLNLALALPATFILAAGSYYFIEMPLLRFGHQFTRPKQ
jgi:peptidoglycan/LPS O-acetylase OafA/YrhL